MCKPLRLTGTTSECIITIMKKLIVVADDFGWTEGVNLGILKAYKEGIVTEISYMLDAPGSNHALELIKKEKIKDVGIHLGLVGWKENKRFFKREDYIRLFKEKSEAEVAKLALKEIEKFALIVGVRPTHIIPQYGIHGNLKLLKTLIKYALKNNTPIRIPQTVLNNKNSDVTENYAAEIMLKRSGVRMTDKLFMHINGEYLEDIVELFLTDLKGVKDGQTIEILTHPGYFDEEILKLSSLNYERARDLAMCMNSKFNNGIEKLGFKLISYSEV